MCKPVAFNFKDFEKLQEEHAALLRDFRDCRNELCVKCGRYKDAHIGACSDCRWNGDAEVKV